MEKGALKYIFSKSEWLWSVICPVLLPMKCVKQRTLKCHDSNYDNNNDNSAQQLNQLNRSYGLIVTVMCLGICKAITVIWKKQLIWHLS